MEIPNLSLPEFVMEHWAGFADKPALIDAATGRALTYAALGAQAHVVAANLAARGMRTGDTFCLYAPNSLEYPIAYYGIQLAGGVPTTANPLYSYEELTKQLVDSRATGILTVPEFLDKALGAAAEAGIPEVFVFGEAPGALPFSLLLADGAPPASNPAAALAALPYSSGTTGTAKGVMLTHANMIAATIQTIAYEDTNANDVTVAFLPFFHIYGQQVILNCGLRQGSTLVVMSRFDFEGFCRAVQHYRATRLYLVPPIVLALAKSPAVANYDFSSVRNIVAGAAPLGAELTRAASERIGTLVRQGYGMTETASIISITPTGQEPPQLDTVGLPVHGCETKLVDGELLVRGPQIMQGYLNRPVETAEMLLPDGWMRTGDIAEIDDNGWIRIVDRCKELIKYKGCQVPPAELEALLVSHPAVADAAVIGIPDEEAGEIPKAFVVRRDAITAEELARFVNERVAPFKKVRQWEFVDVIPKSPSGKILRRLLRSNS